MSCPICGRAVDTRFRPFCSGRCRNVDLGRWLGGRYVIAGPDGEAAPEEGGPDPARDPRRMN